MSEISAPGSESIDVAIVGGGLSGLVTAVRASMAGLRAIVFEKGWTYVPTRKNLRRSSMKKPEDFAPPSLPTWWPAMRYGLSLG
jgi:cation diffusion facilitator CzcD-associated flavoprotein CzcO